MSKRGRKPSKVDVKVKLERSRQSARECRARKKLRYQYTEVLVESREKAIFALRGELETCKKWCKELDQGKVSDGLKKWLMQDNIKIESSAKTAPQKEEEMKEEQGAEGGEGQMESPAVPEGAHCSSSMMQLQ